MLRFQLRAGDKSFFDKNRLPRLEVVVFEIDDDVDIAVIVDADPLTRRLA